MVDVDVQVSSYLKEELAWVIGKWLRVISTKNSKTTKELKGTSRFKFKTILMWSLVMYSNYFEIVSTVTFLGSQSELISASLKL